MVQFDKNADSLIDFFEFERAYSLTFPETKFREAGFFDAMPLNRI